MDNLRTKAWRGIAYLAIAMGLLIFLPAGTIRYWQGWVFLAVFVGGSLFQTLYLLRKDPELLKRRLRAGPSVEKQKAQKIIMVFASIGFIALLVVPALNFRYGWSRAPVPVVIVGDLAIVVGFYLVFRVYKENTFTSATIEIMENQRVISTGPYAVVRHPMYAGSPHQTGSFLPAR